MTKNSPSQHSEKIIYGLHQTQLGEIIVARSDKGLCWMGFMVKGYKGDGFIRMQAFFPTAEFIRDDRETTKLAHDIIAAWDQDTIKEIKLDLRGTAFQQQVWKALLQIPKGQVISYGDVANDIGRPKASRAVGSAVGENPVSLIIPCHRVVQSSGGLGNYGWGIDLKKKILEHEGVA